MAFGDLPLDAPCKPNKGHEGGACNRQSCQAEPALWFNHGSHRWYCADCRNDIQFDPVNLRDWTYRWLPECGHAMFETREMMDKREAEKPAPDPDPMSFEALFGETIEEALGFPPEGKAPPKRQPPALARQGKEAASMTCAMRASPEGKRPVGARSAKPIARGAAKQQAPTPSHQGSDNG